MSEEILRALTQLFAIITKQDGGVTENERQFVITFFRTELDQDSIKEYLELYDNISGYSKQGSGDDEKNKLTSVRDSVKTPLSASKLSILFQPYLISIRKNTTSSKSLLRPSKLKN